MITRAVLVLSAAVAFAASGAPAPAATPVAAPAADPICVLLLPDGGGTLVNRCRSCREVTLERLRAGEGIPNIRAMMLPGEAETPTPFRGPGRTRILGERSCPLPAGRELSQATLRR